MNTPVLKRFCLASIFSILSLGLSAQTVSTFDALGGDNYGGSWVTSGAITFNSSVATVGSPALADGNFEFANIAAGTISANTSLVLNYTARIDSGNLSNSFLVRFADSTGTYAIEGLVTTTTWIAGQWNTGNATLSLAGGGNTSDLTYFTVTGDGTANAVRMSFDSFSISAVPEPATYAALFGILSLGFSVWRKRRKP